MNLKQDLVILIYFYCLYELKTHWIEEICDTPAELASRDPLDAYGEEVWQTVGGKGADF
ncbi:hypothetical protein [Peribacillus frigoritolerans]|uniref:hypothetical protein n=1 Tax=Peribacillus frigoritolerans TaxID=450367 RepID=UPI00330641BB